MISSAGNQNAQRANGPPASAGQSSDWPAKINGLAGLSEAWRLAARVDLDGYRARVRQKGNVYSLLDPYPHESPDAELDDRGSPATPGTKSGDTPPPSDGDMPRGFEMRGDGLWRVPGGEREWPLHVCGPFELVAESRPDTADEWGLLLRWKDRDGTPHEWIVPRRLLAGEAIEVRANLAKCGLYVSGQQGARLALVQFLSSIKVSTRVRTVANTGWYQPAAGGACFVLPDRAIGGIPGEVIRLDMDPAPTVYRARGTLAGWRAEVAARCIGNHRLVFGVACAFAAPLLPLTGDEGGGINLRGELSKGKTTIIDAAASVWGAPSKTGPDAFVRQWRTTSNALETTAASHNHALLPMDEMGQVDPLELAETLYMLANGAGKARARAAGGNRPSVGWLTLILSSGEESAAALAAQVGRRSKAGQEVRLLDVPAIVPGGYGCFDTVHGEADGNAFAHLVRRAAIAEHGTAAPAFLEWLAERLARDPDFVAEAVRRRVAAWLDAHVPRGSDGQVQRAARRLALIGVAGELATVAGITGWPLGAAYTAAAVIFRDWLAERGGTGSREDHHLVKGLRHFITLHGASRFETVRDPAPASQGSQPLPEGVIMRRAGWRWLETNAADGQRSDLRHHARGV